MSGLAVVTISDRCSAGQQVDATGPAVARLLAEQWPGETIGRGLVPDNEEAIATLLRELCHQEYSVILTAGGTGRDRPGHRCRRHSPLPIPAGPPAGHGGPSVHAVGAGLCVPDGRSGPVAGRPVRGQGGGDEGTRRRPRSGPIRSRGEPVGPETPGPLYIAHVYAAQQYVCAGAGIDEGGVLGIC